MYGLAPTREGCVGAHNEAALQISLLQQQLESRDFAIRDLRRQVADLLGHRQQVVAYKHQLELLDERVRARDAAQKAKLDELAAKLRMHETIESQQEAQLLKCEEERLSLQRRFSTELEEAGKKVAEQGIQATQASIQAQQGASDALRWQQELLEERSKRQQAEAQARQVAEELVLRVSSAEGRAVSAQLAADEAGAQASALKAEVSARAAEASALSAELAVLDSKLQVSGAGSALP
ncbi:MAG: hypothetical protein SGPRY_013454 [Prymnesium sp.]